MSEIKIDPDQLSTQLDIVATTEWPNITVNGHDTRRWMDGLVLFLETLQQELSKHGQVVVVAGYERGIAFSLSYDEKPKQEV